MKSNVYIPAAATLIVLATGISPAFAWGDNLTIKTGAGEEITVKKGLLGGKQKVFQDRLGDKYVQKKGLLGTSETEVSLLGNRIKRKKGWFGSSTIEGSTILGDSVTTKKGWLGRKTTTVDLSGVTKAVHSYIASRKPQPAAGTAASGLSTELPPELKAEPQPAVSP